MSASELDHLLQLNVEERYDYFLSQVVEERVVWILVNENSEFLKIYAEEDDFEYLPVWPSAQLAEHYCKTSGDLKPKSISLPEFLKKWIAGLQRDQLEVGVSPGDDGSVWVMTATELKQDLQDELSAL